MNPEYSKYIETIPVLPLRDIVVYPYMIIPLFIGREKSIKCIEASMQNNKKIMLVAQKEASIEKPSNVDLFNIGTVASISQMLKLPDGTIKVLVEGLQRAHINTLNNTGEYFTAQIKLIFSSLLNTKEQVILTKSALKQFEKYAHLSKKIPQEFLKSLYHIDNSEKLADTIAAHMPLKLLDKQSILETCDTNKRLEHLIALIDSEIDLLEIERRIRNRVKKQMEKSQREYYLNEQMKAVQKELGDLEDIPDDNEIIKQKIKHAKMPKDARIKTEAEWRKLKMMSPMSAEATVVRSYIDWMIQIPWHKRSKVKKDLIDAKKILDYDHFGLNEVKERILEYLAVQNRISKIKGPILCLIGPPGVGKTSLGKSIAKATGRKYIRMALGGVRDEAEIRGHRKTYIGSMPGKIIQKISKIGVKNPLFLLDEIDKMSCDVRVDPSSALLEVLDPEQNITFNDHYLETDYDLSDVMFIATANSMNIPAPLLDRMEIIRLSGYTENEKFNIATKHLRKKQIKRNALNVNELIIHDNAIIHIIRYYTREAGVRNLERELSKICRKSVKSLMTNPQLKKIKVTKRNLKKYLGAQKFDYGKSECSNQVGKVTGLAWTEVGGDLLTIEAVFAPGKGKLIYTGSLGKIMQESIQAALTIVRTQSKLLGIEENFYEKNDIHIHVPEGATPKDGPSAGVAMCTAIVSCLTNNPVFSNTAMTGEITLRGNILAIGGLKEKLLAAHRGGIRKVLIPHENKPDIAEIPKNIISKIEIYPLKHIKEVLNLALTNNPYSS